MKETAQLTAMRQFKASTVDFCAACCRMIDAANLAKVEMAKLATALQKAKNPEQKSSRARRDLG